jgi:uncharacterized protein (TIGR02145 family)
MLGLVGIVLAGWLIIKYVIPQGSSGGVDYFPAKITFHEDHVDLGGMKPGESKAFNFTFENTGTAPLEIRSINAASSIEEVLTSRKLLSPGERGDIAVLFKMRPEQAKARGIGGLVTGEILVYTNADYDPIRLSLTVVVEEGTLLPEPEPAPAKPLALSHRFRGDQLFVTIAGGKAPYELALIRDGGPVVYNQEIAEPMIHTIILTPFRERPGAYTLVLVDDKNDRKLIDIKIDPPRNTGETPAQIERTVWEATLQENTMDAYKAYLKAYPEVRYAEEATNRVRAITAELRARLKAEFEAYQEAAEKNTIRAYKDFLERFPDGKYAKSVMEKIAELSREADSGGSSGSESSPFGTITDPRNKRVYKTIKIGGTIWMTENMDDPIKGSWCYLNGKKYCEKYGGLYTLDAAKQACAGLGPGWSLPRASDWEKLANRYGGLFEKDKNAGTMAYKALIQGGKSGLNLMLGGHRMDVTNKFEHLGEHGS